MKTLLQFCIRYGFLPRRRWFFNLVVKHLWRPAAIRDVGQIDGWVEVDGRMTPDQFERFRDWWQDCSKRPEIAGDHAK